MDSQTIPASEHNWVAVDFTSLELDWPKSAGSVTLRVKGTTSRGSERGSAVRLLPATYVTRPEFWRIDLLWDAKDAIFPSETPFDISLVIDQTRGTKGIEIVGKTRSQRIEFLEGAPSAPRQIDDEAMKRLALAITHQGSAEFEQIKQNVATRPDPEEAALLQRLTAIDQEVKARLKSFESEFKSARYKEALAEQVAFFERKSNEVFGLEPEVRRLAEQNHRRPAQMLYHMLPDLRNATKTYIDMHKGLLATETGRDVGLAEQNRQYFAELEARDRLNSARVQATFDGLRLFVV